ncbi:dTDP-4-dehydrorhamnose reductase [Paraburkholderia lycopersici]|uniref:dTDP-4-dehydrorhamnose reductase n=1 Tax=Paraburkholderia lycopersici TaxID=416944 RepID=A0A1G6NFV2_9BURK|nr:dTDP-4-dehydrorhamnose reductase [Paraburkholderia lycopersici]SDC66206.1 dTDP-4-dehydrorhamnose reductase [Paraburkholderia lycopersici]
MTDQRADRVILLTGGTGQVGFELRRSLQGLGKVVAPAHGELDLENPAQLRECVRALRPALIVNPAAYTAVDRAEGDVERARRINAEAPRVLAEEAARIAAPFIHYSTDYVFDGKSERPYVEDDATAPLNTYGATKLEGEQAVAAVGGAHLIFRTSWVYGTRGHNFLLTMLKLAAERDTLRIVADQVGAPTWSSTIASLSAAIAAQALAAGDPKGWWASRSGVYHLTAAGATSWAGFAEAIFADAQLAHVPAVTPISSAEYPTPAARPLNSRLNNEKLARTFDLRAPDWREALRLCIAAR